MAAGAPGRGGDPRAARRARRRVDRSRRLAPARRARDLARRAARARAHQGRARATRWSASREASDGAVRPDRPREARRDDRIGPSGFPTCSATASSSRTLPLGTDDEGDVVATLVRRLPDTHAARRGSSATGIRSPMSTCSTCTAGRTTSSRSGSRGSGPIAARGSTHSTCASTGAACAQDRPRATSPISRPTTKTSPRRSRRWADRRRRHRVERRLVLMGHSTGGLTLSLWARSAPGCRDRADPEQPVARVPAERCRRGPPWRRSWSSGRAMRPLDTAPQVDLGFYTRAQEEAADPTDRMDDQPRVAPAADDGGARRVAERDPRRPRPRRARAHDPGADVRAAVGEDRACRRGGPRS